jgi:uncharacterized protein
MEATYKTPGVYREEEFLKPEPKLPTGVVGFVGFAEPRGLEKYPVMPNAPIVLHHSEDFGLYFKARADSYLAEAVTGFFLNGGTRCYVAFADPNSDPTKAFKALQDAVTSLAPLHDLDLITVPDAATLGAWNAATGDYAYMDVQVKAIADLQAWVLKHCEELGDRLAILDALPGRAQRDDILKPDVMSAAMSGALYYPWLKVRTAADKIRLVPPCGHVAGIFARSDARVGVFKAPANEEVLGAVDLETEVTSSMQEQLNPKGVNCLRAFPGRGIRVWGARTLSEDLQWRYINVRRLFITVRRWIDASMGWAVFEPNSPQLWMRIERELGAYLRGLWQLGALQGRTPEQAFYVKCDAEANPSSSPAEQVVTEIGLAPIAPSEFVVVRIVHRTPLTAGVGGE